VAQDHVLANRGRTRRCKSKRLILRGHKMPISIFHGRGADEKVLKANQT